MTIIEKRKQWFDEAIALLPTVLTPNVDYRQEARELLTPLVKRNKSNSKKAFWQFLRLQILKLKTDDAVWLLEHMQEHRVPLETDAPFNYEVNGDLALIDLQTCVWKIPVKDLTWAKAFWPVYVKELPPLESPELAEARSLKARLRSCRLGFNERRVFEKNLEELEAQIAAGDIRKMPHRHGIFKKVDGQEVHVARLYLRADTLEEVEALDGDLTNFGLVPASTIARPYYRDGVAMLPGIADLKNPVRVTSNGMVSNLFIVQSAANPSPSREKIQTEFEEKVLQVKVDSDEQTLHPHAVDTDGEIIPATNKTTPSNADLGTCVGVEGGKIEDAGRFKPLSVNEAIDLGLQGFETQVPEEIEPSEAASA
jgi:hypothetical protein